MTADTQKQTPILRFPEFRHTGKWDYRMLNELSVPILEKVGEAKLTPVSITAGYGFVSQEEIFGRDISGVQYKNYIFLRRGDFAYNRGNSKKYPQGYVCQLKEFDQAAASTAFICFQLKEGHTAGYFQALFDKNLHGIQLSRYITSGARSDGLLNISAEKFFSINLPVPKLFEEQAKIAACLTSIDELISAESQKLEALKTYKKGMMQQLFPAEGETVPKLRFPEFRDAPKWEEKQLREVCERIMDGTHFSPKSKIGPYMYITSKNIQDGILNIDNISTISEEEHKQIYARCPVRKNDVLLTKDGANTGNCAINHLEFEFSLLSSVAVIRGNELLLDQVFLYQFICSDLMQKTIQEAMAGQAITRITLEKIGSFSISISSIAEQQKIADLLSSIDEQITAQSKRLEALKQHKQGLMQQLFPSSNDVQAIEEDGMKIVEE